MTKWIDADALIRMINDTLQEMYGKKDIPYAEFLIRENMLLNFEQIVRLASVEHTGEPGLTTGECSPARGERDEEDTDIV